MGKIIKKSDEKPDKSHKLGTTVGGGRVRGGETYIPQDFEVHKSQLTRSHPTIEVMGKRQMTRMYKYIDEYMTLLDEVKTSTDLVRKSQSMLEEGEFFNGKNLFLTDKEENAFAAIKYGKRPIRNGARIFAFHNDAPCLKVKSNPLLFEWDPDVRDLHLGVRIDTHPYGCPQIHKYEGTSVVIKGYCYPAKTQKRKEIEMEGYISAVCEHTDKRKMEETDFEEGHPGEALDVITGHENKKELLKDLGLEADDLGSARLFVLPLIESKKLKNYVTGYGQDCRIGAYNALKAMLEIKNPEYTTILLGFDREEVGSGGNVGAAGEFMKRTMNAAISQDPKMSSREKNQGLLGKIYENSFAINTDVDVGSTDREESRGVIKESIAKLGYGPFILGQDGYCESDQVSARLVSRIRNIFIRNDIVSQMVGSPLSVDEDSIPTFGEYLIHKGLETLCVSCGVGGLHGTEEITSEGDLFFAIQGYKAIMQDPRSFNSSLKVKK